LPGSYSLVAYARSTATGTFTPFTRHVVVVPSAELHIDAPTDQSTVNSSFTIRGWAVDVAGATGTGIEAVHVWAFPANRTAAPFLVGVATYGLPRPEVGALLGARFVPSGFELTPGARLPEGTYDLVAFGYRSGTAAARAARLIRITRVGD
jgi:hypothetical protein